MRRKTSIIVGASSGIGYALALELAQRGYDLALTARRVDLLDRLQKKIIEEISTRSQTKVLTRFMDLNQPEESITCLHALIEELGSTDLIILNSGTGEINPDLRWEAEKQTIEVNVTGFTALAGAAMKHFISQKSGHLAAITSVAGLIANSHAPSYCSSKAYQIFYLNSLRSNVLKLGLPITITDIRPGFVDTAMARGDHLFWVSSAQKAAFQIASALEKKRQIAYITRRWSLIALLIRCVPDFILRRVV